LAYGVSVFFGILTKARAGAFRVDARVIVYENGVLSVSKAIYGSKNTLTVGSRANTKALNLTERNF